MAGKGGGLLDGLREFVKVQRKPVWGTCAGLILLAEAANRTKRGGQELIGGLDVRVERNFWGRQRESFEEGLGLGFLDDGGWEGEDGGEGEGKGGKGELFKGVFIRAPVVEEILHESRQVGEEEEEDGVVVAPRISGDGGGGGEWPVEVMGRLPPGRGKRVAVDCGDGLGEEQELGDIVAVRQRNVFGTSFHPELTDDARIHVWWLRQVLDAVRGTTR
ncbi:MAG: hypothetical protein Q9220_006343 [cf. Caloplaca sp. 1 TL-2023]